MAADWVLGENWASLQAALARRLDLEGTAVASRAPVRLRGIDSAATLLRLALVYGGTDLSLRGTALWAKAAGVADVADVACGWARKKDPVQGVIGVQSGP